MQNMQYNILGETFTPVIQLPFAHAFEPGDLIPIDLSVNNTALPREQAMDLEQLSNYVDQHIAASGAKGAYGGYREKRDLYRRSDVFAKSENYRNIHLGIDFWLPEGFEIAAPLPGEIHSFADNDASGDYGPTIVLFHQVGNLSFHSLYGHLSRKSLVGLEVGMPIRRGQIFATLGIPAENRDWPPHLHFQLIRDMGDMQGDYPGVCMESEMTRYLANCPDPNEFLGWKLGQ